MLILLFAIAPFCWTVILGNGPQCGIVETTGENPADVNRQMAFAAYGIYGTRLRTV